MLELAKQARQWQVAYTVITDYLEPMRNLEV